MNSRFQLLLLRSAHIALHCIVGFTPQHSESWTQAIPGDSHLLHTPSRKFLPTGPPACLTSRHWEKGGRAGQLAEKCQKWFVLCPYRQSQCTRAWCEVQIVILHLRCLSYMGSDRYALFQIWPSRWILQHEEHMIALTSIKKMFK